MEVGAPRICDSNSGWLLRASGLLKGTVPHCSSGLSFPETQACSFLASSPNSKQVLPQAVDLVFSAVSCGRHSEDVWNIILLGAQVWSLDCLGLLTRTSSVEQPPMSTLQHSDFRKECGQDLHRGMEMETKF